MAGVSRLLAAYPLVMLTGLQIRTIFSSISGIRWTSLFLYAALMSALVVAMRFLWVFLVRPLSHRWHCNDQTPSPTWQHRFIVAWGGMRGAISLAAALAIPMQLRDGTPFPARQLIIFLTFAVILTTLVLQGLPLPWLVRRLGLIREGRKEQQEEEREETEARLKAAQAALKSLEGWVAQNPQSPDSVDYIRSRYLRRIQHHRRRLNGGTPQSKDQSNRAEEGDGRLWSQVLGAGVRRCRTCVKPGRSARRHALASNVTSIWKKPACFGVPGKNHSLNRQDEICGEIREGIANLGCAKRDLINANEVIALSGNA